MWFEMFKVKRRSAMELKILHSVPHVIGRTRWDRAHTWAIQPDASYHHCNELLSGGSLINLHSKYDIEQKSYREFNG